MHNMSRLLILSAQRPSRSRCCCPRSLLSISQLQLCHQHIRHHVLSRYALCHPLNPQTPVLLCPGKESMHLLRVVVQAEGEEDEGVGA